jgi:Caspase domain
VTNADFDSMWTAIEDYASTLAEQSGQVVSFVYYSGHGMSQPNTGENFLIPVDVKDLSNSAVWHKTVKLTDVTRLLMRKAPNAAHFVVFDACRSVLRVRHNSSEKGVNSNTDVSSEKGFSRPADTPGIFIAFSTSPETVASDEGADGGPYAKVLASELHTPGIDHVRMFHNVKRRVFNATRETQFPWDTDGLVTSVYFNPRSLPETPRIDKTTKSDVEVTPTQPPAEDVLLNLVRASHRDRLEFSSNVSMEALNGPIDLLTLYDFTRLGYSHEMLFWLFAESVEVTVADSSYRLRYDPPNDYGCARGIPGDRCFIDFVRLASLIGLTVEKTSVYPRFCFSRGIASEAQSYVSKETLNQIGNAFKVDVSPRCGDPLDPRARSKIPQPDTFKFSLAGITFTITPRNGSGAFAFLGAVLRAEWDHLKPLAQAYLPASRRLDVTVSPMLFSVHPSSDQRLITVVRGEKDCFARTSFDDGDYCVPQSATNTKQIFGVLQQLLNRARR